MNIRIFSGVAKGTVAAPPSKSMAHRLLIGAGLAGGASTVRHVAFSQDIRATLDCLRALGANVAVQEDRVQVFGNHPANAPEGALLACRESGSTLRFFVPLCLLGNRTRVLTGSSRLLERPQWVYETLCRQQWLTFTRLPDRIITCGPLRRSRYTVPGNVSSQFVSGLLFALPFLESDSLIKLKPPVESRSYIDLTLQALHRFGVTAGWQSETALFVQAGTYKPADVTVEGDYSNAAFWHALNVLGGQITVTGLQTDSLQGDRVYQELFPRIADGMATVSLADCPDLGPIVMALAAACHGAVLTDTARLRMKESDRDAAMAAELAKFGAAVTVEENRITVHGGALHPPTEPLCGHNDHRIVMALATLCTVTGGVITGAEAVAKSYPDYFERLAECGIEWKEESQA